MPNSWTIEKTMSYFSVAKRCVSSARELKKSSGIYSILSKKKGKTLSDEIKLNIHSIYNSDVLLNLKELYKEYLKRYEKTVGISKFCELRPK